jgi:LuxR family transcriptional regulator, maltose regulon positive regulatory protein
VAGSDLIPLPSRPIPRRPGILETKLLLPRQTHALVARPRLLDRLVADPQVPLVGVFGPAGFGKTTLLAQWASMDRRAVAWLTLDEREADTTALLSYVAAAIDRATGLPGSVLGSVGVADPADWQTALSQLGAALATTREPLLIVLDDVERVGPGEPCEAIVALSALLPPGSQVALSSRRSDVFPVPRLVTAGLMTLIERDDLVLDDREAEELFRLIGRPLAADQAHDLNHAFEGWAAGLYLSAMNQRSITELVPTDDALVAHRMVGEYVRSEIVGSMSPERRDLVLRASAFDPFDAAMVGAILGTEGVDDVLRDVARTTPLLIELDVPGKWYRWHRLLRAVLKAELAHREPDAPRALAELAAAWYERAGMLETAIDFAMQAGDAARVARSLPRLVESAWNEGRIETLLAWLDWFETQDGPGAYPRVAMLGSLIYGLVGRSARALRWADLARVDQPSRIQDSDAGFAALVRASMCRAGVARMADDAEMAVSLLPADSTWSPTARILLGVALALEGRRRSADVELAAATELASASDSSPTHAAIGLVFRASLAMDRGDWTAAEALARLARTIVLDGEVMEGAAGLAVDAMSARIAARRGALHQATADAVRAQRLRANVGHAVPWLAIRARLDLTWALLALADPAAADTVLGEAEEVVGRDPAMGVLVEEIEELRGHLERSIEGPAGASMLTLAELRLLPILATHRSLPEIAAQAGRSSNTIKTQAKSIYRKLEATSRSEAVDRARALGLLDGAASNDALTA